MNVQDHVRRYTVDLSNRMNQICSPLKDQLGINYFTYHTLSSEGEYSVIVSNPEFAEYFTSNKFYYEDPFIRHPDNFHESAVLWKSYGSDRFKNDLLNSIKTEFNFDHGISLIRKSRNFGSDLEIFGFASPTNHQNASHYYLNHLEIFKGFCDHFTFEASSILKKMSGNPIQLKDLIGDAFFEINPIPKSVPYPTFLNSPSHPPDLISCLSARERDCLLLYSRGKTASKTGKILNLSTRTVEHYMESVKNKLNCERKTDLLDLIHSKKITLR